MEKRKLSQIVLCAVYKYRNLFGFLSLLLLILCSIIQNYNFGFLVGFILVSLIAFLPEIKRVIIDFKISEIYGIKFDVDSLKNELRKVVENEGETLKDSTLDKVAIAAVNRMIKGSPYIQYEEDIASVLHNLGYPFTQNTSVVIGGSRFFYDFIVDIKHSESIQTVIIEAKFFKNNQSSERVIEQISKMCSSAYKYQGKTVRFLMISNREFSLDELKRISTMANVPIEFIKFIKFDMNKDVLFEDLKNYFGKVENE